MCYCTMQYFLMEKSEYLIEVVCNPQVSGFVGMMGYGMAKAAVHQLVKSLAAENSGLPANSSTVAILP